MIRVTVEIVPLGVEERAFKVGEIVIAQDGADEAGHKYKAWMAGDDWDGSEARYGEVKGHDRRKSVWGLIQKVLVSCLYRKPSPGKSELARRLRMKLSGEM